MRRLFLVTLAAATMALIAAPAVAQMAAPDQPAKSAAAKKKKPAKKQAQSIAPPAVQPTPMPAAPGGRPGFLERQGSGENSSFGASGGLTSGDGTRSGASVGDMGNR